MITDWVAEISRNRNGDQSHWLESCRSKKYAINSSSEQSIIPI